MVIEVSDSEIELIKTPNLDQQPWHGKFRVFAELSSLVTVLSFIISATISYIQFESIGVDFFQIVGLDDVALIGIGLLVRIYPLIFFGFLYFLILRTVIGYHQSTWECLNEDREGFDKKPLYSVFFFFLSLATFVFILLSHPASNLRSIDVILVFSGFTALVMITPPFVGNYLLKKKVINFRSNDVQYYFPNNSKLWSWDEGMTKKYELFRSRILKFVTILLVIDFLVITVEYSSSRFGIQGYMIDTPVSNGLICKNAPVIWSGSRGILMKCGKKMIVLQNPENSWVAVKKIEKPFSWLSLYIR